VVCEKTLTLTETDSLELARLAKAVGLRERRVAADGVTALDLCADAASAALTTAYENGSTFSAAATVSG
jgi:3-oxoacyl-[acyl-carrier-protein] synthase III